VGLSLLTTLEAGASVEADDEPFGEYALQRRGKVEGGVFRSRSGGRSGERDPVGNRFSESEGARVERPPCGGIAVSADLDAGSAAREIDGRRSRSRPGARRPAPALPARSAF
jgi:hypothetical protein